MDEILFRAVKAVTMEYHLWVRLLLFPKDELEGIRRVDCRNCAWNEN